MKYYLKKNHEVTQVCLPTNSLGWSLPESGKCLDTRDLMWLVVTMGKRRKGVWEIFERVAVVSEDEESIGAVPHRTRQLKEQKPGLLSGITQCAWEENAV